MRKFQPPADSQNVHNKAAVSVSIPDETINSGDLIPGKQGTGSEVCWGTAIACRT